MDAPKEIYVRVFPEGIDRTWRDYARESDTFTNVKYVRADIALEDVKKEVERQFSEAGNCDDSAYYLGEVLEFIDNLMK